VDVAYKTAVGLTSDGRVKSYGDYAYRNEVEQWTGIVDVSVSYKCIVGLKADGTVVVASENNFISLSDWSNIIDVEAIFGKIYGIKADGSVVVYGSDYDGITLLNHAKWTDIVAIETRTYGDMWCAFGLKKDGTVAMAGSAYKSRVGELNWRDITAIGVGSCTAGLRKDGTVVIAEHPLEKPVDWSAVKGWRDIVDISVGYEYMIGLKADGTMVAAGSDSYIEEISSWSNVRIP